MDSFRLDSVASVGEKLRAARKGMGLSTREVAGRLAGTFQVSHATIANYEKGSSQPTLDVLGALAALYDRPMKWFVEYGPMLSGIRYRNLPSRVRQSEKHQFEAESLRWLEAYLRIETFLNASLSARRRPSSSWGTKPEVFAERVRRELGIAPDAPVPSVIDALEAFGIRVVEVSTTLRIDGFAALLGKEPVVILNSDRPEDRIRLNASHELFHVLLGHCVAIASSKLEHKGDEDAAFACARHFLLPKVQLREAFLGESFVKLVKFKERFGISISAMIYAARQEGILSESTARFLWIEISKRGWREKEPGVVRPDRATRFELLVDSAVCRGVATMHNLAQIGGVREAELSERIRVAQGISGVRRDDRPWGQEGDDPNFRGLRLAQ